MSPGLFELATPHGLPRTPACSRLECPNTDPWASMDSTPRYSQDPGHYNLSLEAFYNLNVIE